MGGTPETVRLEESVYTALQVEKLCSIASYSSRIFHETHEDEVKLKGEVDEERPVRINTRPFKCYDHLAGLNELDSVGVFTSADISLTNRENGYRMEIELSLYDAVQQKNESKAQAISGAIGVGNKVPPGIDLGRDRCGLFHLVGCAKNYGKKKIERTYGRQRARAFSRYQQTVNTRADQAASTVEEVIFEARASAYEMLSGTTVFMRNAINQATVTWSILSSILTFLLIFGIVKSILYVLATEVFHESSGSSMTFDTESKVQGSFSSASNMILKPSDRQLVSRKAFTNQKQKSKLFPYPFKALRKRIFDGSWLSLNIGGYVSPLGRSTKSGGGSASEGIEIAAPDGSVIVHWKMKDGEEVVFDFRNFYAASENVRIRTDISLRLSTLLLGRFVFHYAVCKDGPGDLLLKTTGVSSLRQSQISSVHLDTLVAFNRHTKFRTKDDRQVTSVFLDGFSIQRLNPGKRGAGNILVATQYQTSSRIVGAWRFIKTLILPI